MQIIINESEIVEAIKDYVGKQGIVTAGKDVTVGLTAGRGANGTTATVEIAPVENTDKPPETANTMQENFSLESKTDKVVNDAVDEVEEILNTEAAKDVVEEPEKDEEPEKVVETDDVNKGEDDVDSLFQT